MNFILVSECPIAEYSFIDLMILYNLETLVTAIEKSNTIFNYDVIINRIGWKEINKLELIAN